MSDSNQAALNEGVNSTLDTLKTKSNVLANSFDATHGLLSQVGIWGMFTVAILCAVAGIAVPVKGNYDFAQYFPPMLYGISGALFAVVAMYTAQQFLPRMKTLARAEAVSVSAASMKIGAIASFSMAVFFIVNAINLVSQGEHTALLPGIGYLAIFSYLTAIFLNPALINVKAVKNAKANQDDIISLLSVLFKSALVIAPFVLTIEMLTTAFHLLNTIFGDAGQRDHVEYATEFYQAHNMVFMHVVIYAYFLGFDLIAKIAKKNS